MKLFKPEQLSRDQIARAGLEHVLVIQPGDSSDIVMLSPVLRALRQALPDADVTLMTSPAGGQMSPLLPWVDQVMVDQAVVQDGAGSRSINPREEIAFIERLRQQNISIALIFSSISQSPIRAAYACYLAGVPYRVAFATGTAGSVVSHPLPAPADDLHQVDRNLILLQAIGIPEAERRMELNIPENVENRANELLGMAGLKLSVPYTILAPANTPGRCSPENFAAVARVLASQPEQQLVVVGTAEKIRPALEAANEGASGSVYSLVDSTTLPELAAIIRQASLTITNNSIHMHFADAFGCPLVVLHSETDRVERWMPRNADVRLLSRPEDLVTAALEMLTQHAYRYSDAENLFAYRLGTEGKDQSSDRQ